MEKNSFLFTPDETAIDQRIDKVLGQHESVGSRSKAEFLLGQGLVTLRGKSVKPSYRVSSGDQFLVEIPPPEEQDIQAFSLALEIPFEDDDLIVVNKPAGLVVHPAAGHENDTLVNALVGSLSQFSMKFGENRPGIVHRLDKDTSGLLVIAKNDYSQEKLVEQFKERSVHRRYQALAFAPRLLPAGSFQSYLARHPVDRKRYASLRDPRGKIITDPNVEMSVGKWAKTNYQILKRNPSGLALISLKLETGRTHQIRVHLSENSAPIIADPIYGKSKLGTSKAENEFLSLIPRLCLHAKELGFVHPRSGKALQFTAEWPKDVSELLGKLGFLEVSK